MPVNHVVTTTPILLSTQDQCTALTLAIALGQSVEMVRLLLADPRVVLNERYVVSLLSFLPFLFVCIVAAVFAVCGCMCV